MDDYIRRKTVLDAAELVISRDTSGKNAVVNAMIAWSEYIKGLPSENVQPVVRCKDCKHSYVFEPWEGINATRYCKIFKNHYGDSDFCVNDDDFCSYGEKKDG